MFDETVAPSDDSKLLEHAVKVANGEAELQLEGDIPGVDTEVEAKTEEPPKEEPKTEEPKQESQPETPPESEEVQPEKPKEPEEEDKGPISRGWEAVARREKMLTQKHDELRAMEQRLSQMRQQFEQHNQQQADIAQGLKTNLWGTLQQLGVNVEDALRQVMHGENMQVQKPQPQSEVAQLREELKSLTSIIQEQKTNQEEQRYQSQIGQVLADPEFALLAANPNALNEVYKVACQYTNQFGVVPDPRLMVAETQKVWQKQLSTLGANKAVREVFGLEVEEPDSESEVPPTSPPAETKKPRKKGRVVTNKLAATPTNPEPLPDGLSEEEEIARASKLLAPDATLMLTEF